jgi:hypothetical protein
MNLRSAVKHVNNNHALLIFPINNKKEPRSLWSEFFPRTKMRWEWDESGSEKVSGLWHLREELSRSGQVVYTKWYRSRATALSRKLFPALLKSLNTGLPEVSGLSFTAREILDILEEDSPVSTKRLKALSGLQGRENESRYNRALKELWSRCLIVGFGEIDEGAFPSLAIGATRLIFEDLWQEAVSLDLDEALVRVKTLLEDDSPFLKFHAQLLNAQVRLNEVQLD